MQTTLSETFHLHLGKVGLGAAASGSGRNGAARNGAGRNGAGGAGGGADGPTECLTADDVTRAVEAILAATAEAGASDVHLIPGEHGLAMHWRIDGVLHAVASFPVSVAANIVARLKVLAGLLTYQTEIPQQGRIREGSLELETRVSTFPTLYGEKAVVRMFVGSGRYRRLDDLGLPAAVRGPLDGLLLENGGVLLVTGPAGSGKTTTIYACLRELLHTFGQEKSLVTLEDPVEAVVPGVSQSQIRPSAGFTYEIGLKSLLRQDPDVIVVGEIRDKLTAETVFQAALSGHLVLTTFHSGSSAEAVSRLCDMGIEPYLLRSSVLGIVWQRLLRRLCACAVPASEPAELLGIEVAGACVPRGCATCGGTGFHGRMMLAELLLPGRESLSRAILSRSSAGEIESAAAKAGMCTRWDMAREAIATGATSAAEVRRVLGFREATSSE